MYVPSVAVAGLGNIRWASGLWHYTVVGSAEEEEAAYELHIKPWWKCTGEHCCGPSGNLEGVWSVSHLQVLLVELL